MIPKVIHYCWISGDPFPEKIQRCYDSWKRVLPDYEIVVWDYAKAHAIGSKWVDQAIATKKYAFVADYIRFYALYNYGGIYLDSDVEVLKSFDELLPLRYFVGKENSASNWEAAIIGAEPHMYWIYDCLNYYKGRRFINAFGDLQTIPLPRIMNANLSAKYKIADCFAINQWFYADDTICRFPVDWFSPKRYDTLELNVTKQTYCIHHFSGSWLVNSADYKRTPSQSILFFLRRCWRWPIKKYNKLFNKNA